MPIPFTCPSCRRSGKLPNTFPGGRIKCPNCGTLTVVEAGAVPKPAAPTPTPRPASATKPAPAFDDLDDAADEVEPVARPSVTRGARSPQDGSSRPAAPMALLVGGGIGGAVLLVIGLVVVLASGGKKDQESTATTPSAPVAQAEAAPSPATTPVVPALTNASNASGTTTVTSAYGQPPAPTTYGQPVAPSSSTAPVLTVAQMKDATVFIKVRTAKAAGSGSGFVIKADGGGALVATNHHVVSPPGDGKGPPQITVVFRSGTPEEQELPATVLAADDDHEEEHNRDLAILTVQGVRNPPRPLDLSQRPELVETKHVIIYGFPLGDMNRIINNKAGNNPSITVTSNAAISSLRKDRFNQLTMVQIDGSIIPGNSGGPVVDDQGRLIGVCVAQIRNTAIGFAIPSRELVRLLDGRLGTISLSMVSESSGTADVQVRAPVLDPFQKIRAVELRVAPAPTGDGPAIGPKADGNWPPLANASTVPMAMSNQVASAQFKAPVTGQDRRILVQAAFRDAGGRTFFGHPDSIAIPAKPGATASSGSKPKEVKVAFDRLGELVDPDKDCKLKKEENDLAITIPGKLHSLSPEVRDKKGKSKRNAPRLLTEVTGDFMAHVRVAGTIRPGNEPATGPNGKKLPLVVQGGGLLLWEDEDNFFRLERSGGSAAGSVSKIDRLILEVCKNGKAAPPIYTDIGEGPLHVMILRHEGAIRCMFSNDPAQGWKAFRELSIDFPDQVSVGLSAFNTSKKAYTAHFEDFVLITDKGQFEQELKPPGGKGQGQK